MAETMSMKNPDRQCEALRSFHFLIVGGMLSVVLHTPALFSFPDKA